MDIAVKTIDELRHEPLDNEFDMFKSHPVTSQPMKQFFEWYSISMSTRNSWANNFTLITVDSDNQPQGRTVSLHTFDERGFILCTNTDGPKARDIERNPKVSMVFQWEQVRRQIRITGVAHKITRQETTVLFERTSRAEQLYFYECSQGKSHPFSQSNIYQDDQALKEFVTQIKEKYGYDGCPPVPLPDHWSGYRITPTSLEFLDISSISPTRRLKYTKKGHEWIEEKLAL